MSVALTNPDPLNELSPADLAALTVDRQGHQCFDKFTAIALHKLGESAMATRHDNCGKFFRMHLCPNGHTFRVSGSRCQMRFACPQCSKLRATELIDKHLPLSEVIPPFQILYIEKSCIRRSDYIKSYSNQLAAWSKSKRTKPDLYLQWIDKHQNGVLYIRVIYSGPLPLGQIVRERWRDCNVQIRNCYPAQFKSEIVDFMRVDLPDHPEARAELEILFHGIRQLRSSGSLVSGYLKERSTNTTNHIQDESNNPPPDPSMDTSAPEEPAPAHAKGSCRCPKCGKRSVAVSQQLTFMLPTLQLEWHQLKIPSPEVETPLELAAAA